MSSGYYPEDVERSNLNSGEVVTPVTLWLPPCSTKIFFPGGCWCNVVVAVAAVTLLLLLLLLLLLVVVVVFHVIKTGLPQVSSR